MNKNIEINFLQKLFQLLIFRLNKFIYIYNYYIYNYYIYNNV